MSGKLTPPASPPLPTIEKRPLHSSGSQTSNWTFDMLLVWMYPPKRQNAGKSGTAAGYAGVLHVELAGSV